MGRIAKGDHGAGRSHSGLTDFGDKRPSDLVVGFIPPLAPDGTQPKCLWLCRAFPACAQSVVAITVVIEGGLWVKTIRYRLSGRAVEHSLKTWNANVVRVFRKVQMTILWQ